MKKNKAKTQHVLDTNIHKQGKQNKVIQGKALSSLSTGFSNNSNNQVDPINLKRILILHRLYFLPQMEIL